MIPLYKSITPLYFYEKDNFWITEKPTHVDSVNTISGSANSSFELLSKEEKNVEKPKF